MFDDVVDWLIGLIIVGMIVGFAIIKPIFTILAMNRRRRGDFRGQRKPKPVEETYTGQLQPEGGVGCLLIMATPIGLLIFWPLGVAAAALLALWIVGIKAEDWYWD